MSVLSLNALLPIALSGTQHASLPQFHEPKTALLQALQQHAHPSTATQLLRLSAVASRYERMVYQAPKRPENSQTLSLPQQSQNSLEGITPTLHTLFPKPNLAHCIAIWRELAQAQRHLPASVLPDCLEIAYSHSVLRPWLMPILGPQGLFLAQCNPKWKFAIGTDEHASDEEAWQYGSVFQRVQVLQQQRQHHPQQARERLQDTLEQKNLKVAKERKQLLEVLWLHLSEADEALLEFCLDDRSSEVSLLAAQMLVNLPNSALSQRMQALLPLLLQQDAKGKWLLEPLDIEAAPAQWQRDGIAIKPPSHHLFGSPKAWLLHQMVRMIPLQAWQQYTGMDINALWQWSATGDVKMWQDALRSAWKEAIFMNISQVDLNQLPSKILLDLRHNNVLHNMLVQCSDSDQEAFWQQQLGHILSLDDVVTVYILRPVNFSLEFSQFLYQFITQQLQPLATKEVDLKLYSWIASHQSTLISLVWLLHPDVATKLSQLPWPRYDNQECIPDYCEELNQKLLAQQQMRTQWQQALANCPTHPFES
ncbi:MULTISPECIES: DUF5691 domain-containing protein [Vitreoscilla]|uniref:DUF5691 domain-containing protein n=1 Tax=Vitreoscilla stercoraria TaxID=61 RepID=A0ABY4EFN5_VITST|nr:MULTISPECIES: DUF5691 domain-containing protein [Vitreoscilla]AUZ05120.2 hypothetical protein ADP71_15440 [Vitreoscilla sp. C1]UOO93528.1 DUF5691 domain-containing protein [Vitreoscilla stercoraria]